MSFVNSGTNPHAFWVTESGGLKVLTPEDAAVLPIDGRMELSLLSMKNCRDVLVACNEGQSTIFWDARHTKRTTIDHSLSLINSIGAPAKKIRFHTLIDAWLTTDFDELTQANDQLDWFDLHKNVLILPHTNVVEKNFEDMLNESSFLSSAFAAWRDAVKGGDSDQLFRIVNHALLYEIEEKGGPMELVYPGTYHPISLIYGDDWQRRTVTMAQLQKATDTRYEERVTGAYDDVISCKEPRYDHIHAYIRIKNGLPRWARYRRLLLPWPAHGSARAIYCLAEQTNHIEIPFLQAA